MNRKVLLAIDVGGSNTRAYLVDAAGNCLGQGRNRGGNPASNTPEQAAAAITTAVADAVADAGGGPFDMLVAQIALAGPQGRVAVSTLEAAFRGHGLTGRIAFAGDLLAMFASSTAATDGYCVVAGTGAGVVRIRGGEIERVIDAAGWLLGDLGSGYWLGHQAARAVTADLEGRGERTALTPALLDDLGVERDDERVVFGRTATLQQFIDTIYGLRPIELARFARYVIGHRADDAVAAGLLRQAERYLVADFERMLDPAMRGPTVIGGGIAPHLTGLPAAIGAVLEAAGHEPDVRLVVDGSVGAVVLALRSVGIPVDEATVSTIAASVAARTAQVSAPGGQAGRATPN